MKPTTTKDLRELILEVAALVAPPGSDVRRRIAAQLRKIRNASPAQRELGREYDETMAESGRHLGQ